MYFKSFFLILDDGPLSVAPAPVAVAPAPVHVAAAPVHVANTPLVKGKFKSQLIKSAIN